MGDAHAACQAENINVVAANFEKATAEQDMTINTSKRKICGVLKEALPQEQKTNYVNI